MWRERESSYRENCSQSNQRDSTEWVEIKLGELCETRNGYTPSKQVPEYWEDGTIPWYRMEDIRANGHILYDSIQHIHPSGLKKSGTFPVDSIILATTATIGEHALLKTPALSNQRFTCFIVKDKYKQFVDIDYLYWYFFIIDEWCKANANTGTSFPTVDVQRLKEYKLWIPKSLQEQKRISSILQSYDNLIESQQQLLKIVERESSYRSNCSSVNNYTSNWRRVKLKDIVTISSSGSIKKSEYLESGEYQIIGANGCIGYTDKKNNNHPVLTTGRVGTIGTIHKVSGAWITDNTLILDIKDTNQVSYNYLYHILNTIDFKAITTGNAQPLITSGRLKEVEIWIPDLIEQQRISSLLDNYDEMIESQGHLIRIIEREREQLQRELFID